MIKRNYFKEKLMKKLLCIDGNSILNRQFYGIRYLSNREGFPTNAIYGMINVIGRQLDELSPDYCAIAFDLKAPTFRHKMFADYKAGRRPMPDELRVQMPVAKEICAALGFSVLELAGFEADDILGTLGKMAEQAGDVEAYILTGDRDSLQLISGNVRVLLATNSDTIVYDNAAFFAKYGVNANQYVDVKALMGDSSDNIPGVPGIGEKTAFKLISECGTLNALYDSIENIKLTPSVKAKLSANRELAFMSQDLARINCDVPIINTLDDIKYNGVNKAAARELFIKYDLTGALKRFCQSEADEADKSESATSPAVLEIHDIDNLDAITDEYCAVSVCDGEMLVSDSRGIYRAAIGDNIAAFLSSHKIICFDSKALYYELDALGVHFRDAYFDISLAAYVVNSSEGTYNAERLVTTYLHEEFNSLIPPICYELRLFEALERKLEESGQKSLLMDIEMPLAAVLCDMEKEGFKVDRAGIEGYGAYLDNIASELSERIFLAAGGEFNINSPKQLGEVLFERLMLPTGKKTKTGYSTGAEVLEKLRKYHPIIDDILDYRQVTKLKSTYVDGLLKVMDSEDKIHTTFKQTVTATGRLSSTEPNLQNIPIRTELGREFRKFFIPAKSDRVLIDADYSQIELRVLAHISGDEHMIGAFISGDDIHTSTACRVFGITPEEMTVELRKKAKAINFGILYGMGEFSLSEDLKIPIYRAKEYIESYLHSYPAIEKYLDDIVRFAKRDGYVTTMLGRRRYIPELSAQNKNIQHFGERIAKNSPIQGSSADIIKRAMINVSRRLAESGLDARLILQVHDELIVEASRDCAERVLELLKSEMESAIELSVPLIVDAKIGDTWYACH